MTRAHRVIVGLLLAAGGISQGIAAGRERSVWDGVYSEAQASRGESVYRKSCALCHGPALEGTESAPELLGTAFLKPFYGKSVQDLFTQVKEKMPKDAPGTLTAQQTTDVLAYVFKANRMPIGTGDMPAAADALAEIRIGPRPQ